MLNDYHFEIKMLTYFVFFYSFLVSIILQKSACVLVSYMTAALWYSWVIDEEQC